MKGVYNKMGWLGSILLLGIWACNPDTAKMPERQLIDDTISFHWNLDSINIKDRKSYITLDIKNNGTETLDQGWSIYFNQIMPGTDAATLPSTVEIINVNGSLYQLRPTPKFQGVKSGEQITFSYVVNAFILRKSDAPVGIYIVRNNEKAMSLSNAKVTGMNKETLSKFNVESPQSRFDDNAKYASKPMSIVDMVIPTPKNVENPEGDKTYSLSSSFTIQTIGDPMAREVDWLQTLFRHFYTGKSNISTSASDITLKLSSDYDKNDSGYYLNVSSDGVSIMAGNTDGIFNGITTLAQLASSEEYQNADDTIELPYVNITDAPTYPYRGIMLDVSRNFHSKEAVKKLIDVMAFYKLNKFHFHIGDDEGWRLEIPGLPELTEVGGRRGHTTDESDFLYAMYGSGPHPEPEYSYGSGWYTRDEYIDIIRYAESRHIEVIPEIDMPGHARAAIIAMRNRYHKYIAEGNKKEAERYLLHDPQDTSVYSSAQGYGDNTMCTCRESTFDFAEKVIDEVVAMHKEAGQPLKTLHGGGDEVAYGSWMGSPLCQDFIKANTESVSHTDELQAYFTARLKTILDKHGLNTAGWEEYILKNSSEGHNGKEINSKFIGEPFTPYVWNATWGWGREDMAYKLANAGFDVVMCNSAQLYFDMAYNMDPEENGLMWTGMVDTKNPFFMIPENIYNMPYKLNSLGVPVSDDLFENHTRLSEDGKKHIKGLQGELWSETITDPKRIEYYIFPKALGLSERAWNPNPTWSKIPDRENRIDAMETDWGVFSQKMGRHQMPMMDIIFDGIGYRVPLPGAAISGDELIANVRFPGLIIRYTLDGSEVTASSPLYSGPVKINETVKVIKLKTFTQSGRMSRESLINL